MLEVFGALCVILSLVGMRINVTNIRLSYYVWLASNIGWVIYYCFFQAWSGVALFFAYIMIILWNLWTNKKGKEGKNGRVSPTNWRSKIL